MVKQRFACVKGKPVSILDRATKSLKLKRGQIAVQSLKTGETAIVKRNSLKKVSSTFPRNKNKC